MSNPTVKSKITTPLYRTERVIASLTMAWVIILTTYMIFQDHALSYTSIYFLKIIMSLSGAVMLATLPGFFDVNYSLGGFSVRAAGGAAAFVFIYTQSPNLPSLDANRLHISPGREESAKPPAATPQSAKADGMPLLMALVIAPASVTSSASRTDYSGASVQAQTSAQLQSGRSTFLLQAHRVSIGGAVSDDLRALSSFVTPYAIRALESLKSWLDLAAGALRHAVSNLLDAVGRLLGLGAGVTGSPPTIGVFEEDVTAQLDDVGNPLSGSAELSLYKTLAGLSDLGQSLTSELLPTMSGVVAITDRTVGEVLLGVQKASHRVLDGADKLAGNVTLLLNDLTAGATHDSSETVDRVRSHTIAGAGKLGDRTVRKVTAKSDRVLRSVNAGLDKATQRLNVITPRIVSRIDSNWVVAQSPLDIVGGEDLDQFKAISGEIDGAGGSIVELAMPDDAIRSAQPLPMPGQLREGQGGERPSTGALCIPDCGALDQTNIAGGIGRGLFSGGNASVPAGGGVSSVGNAASAVAGGTAKSLGRR